MGYLFLTFLLSLSFAIHKGGVIFNVLVFLVSFLYRFILVEGSKNKNMGLVGLAIAVILGLIFWWATVSFVGCGVWTTVCPEKFTLAAMIMEGWGKGMFSLSAYSGFQYLIVVIISSIFAGAFGQFMGITLRRNH